MLPSKRLRAGRTPAIAVVAALAVAAAWAAPRQSLTAGIAMVDGAAAAPRVAAAMSAVPAARDDAFDGWLAARTQRFSYNSRGSGSESPVPVGTEAERSAREAAAGTTSVAAKESPKPEATKTRAAPTYRGTNHFWIPSLGMSYGVHSYGCSASYYPRNLIYRWGCAGTNNVYLFGHAHSVMKPLHDLYVSGGLRKGMVAVYANANGKVTKYRVTEWRVVRPTQIAWQIASQPRPSMTLQTCIGKDSEYRLNVRLVAFD